MRKKLTLSAASLALAFSSYAQLSGVKTINPVGSGADNYASFSEAVTALQAAGVNGPVTFNVAPGVYKERFTINAAATAGASATNQIIFQKDPAATGDVFVRPSTAGSTVVNLYDASWVTLDGINLEDGGSAAAVGTNRGMQLSGAQYCTLKNFTIRMNSRGQLMNPVSRGIASATSFGNATRPMRYNKFDNLRIVHVANRAFSLFSDFGDSDINVENRDRGNVVTNCHIDSVGGGFTGSGTNATCLAAFFLEQDSLVFKNNRITNMIHQPTAASPMTALQVSSNPDEAYTRGPVIENNVIGSIVTDGSPSFVEDNFNGLILGRTTGLIFRNNTISDIEAKNITGVANFNSDNLIFEKNTIRNLSGLEGDAAGILISGDSTGTYYRYNTIANIKSDAVAATNDVIGIDIQSGVDVRVAANSIDSVYASNISEGPTATGIRVSAAITNADAGLPEGGKSYVYNNFISNVYQENADIIGDGSSLAFGISSVRFVDANQLPVTGGQQHIAHNTIVLNRPDNAPIAHPTVGAVLFGDTADADDAITFTNNILINRNTHADGSDIVSLVIQFSRQTENFMSMGNNFSGHDGVKVLFGADRSFDYPFFADWKTAGYDAMMTTGLTSDTIAVTFTNEADGDLHVSEADYANAGLRRTPVSWVAKDIDGTDRASGDTQVGADAQTGEVNIVSVKANLKSAKSLVVFPNPAREDARFAMNVTKATTATVTVRNLMGQTVATKTVTLNAGANTAGINVANLSSGIYVYTVAAEGNVFTGKFIKE